MYYTPMRPDKVIFGMINLVISCDQNFASHFTQLAAHATTTNKKQKRQQIPSAAHFLLEF